MALYIKDETVVALTTQFMTAYNITSKTEAVRLALQQGIEQKKLDTPLPLIARQFCLDLKAKF